jgi:uncharacterized membrane protein YfcA
LGVDYTGTSTVTVVPLPGSERTVKVLSRFNITTLAETITFTLTIGLEAFRWDIVVTLLVGGVIAAPVAAWVCKKLPHRTMGILIGVR